MSVSKNDQVFPKKSSSEVERKIALAVSRALRQDYSELTSAVKWIGRKTGAHPRAIRNWYEARNAPNSVHLLLLARSSAHVLRILLELIERVDLAEFSERGFSETDVPDRGYEENAMTRFYGEESFTIKVTLSPALAIQLNQRQLWFLGVLQESIDARAGDIATAWSVTLRSAKFDIAGLTKLGLIRFTGSKKNGRYEAQKM